MDACDGDCGSNRLCRARWRKRLEEELDALLVSEKRILLSLSSAAVSRTSRGKIALLFFTSLHVCLSSYTCLPVCLYVFQLCISVFPTPPPNQCDFFVILPASVSACIPLSTSFNDVSARLTASVSVRLHLCVCAYLASLWDPSFDSPLLH